MENWNIEVQWPMKIIITWEREREIGYTFFSSRRYVIGEKNDIKINRIRKKRAIQCDTASFRLLWKTWNWKKKLIATCVNWNVIVNNDTSPFPMKTYEREKIAPHVGFTYVVMDENQTTWKYPYLYFSWWHGNEIPVKIIVINSLSLSLK